MKLDSRIKSLSDVLTCFDIERAKQYVDTMGYFTDDISDFNNLDDCYYDTLNRVDDNSSRLFFNKYLSKYFTFFLPEKFIKQGQAKKKYRPYTFMEFTDKFTIGCPIKFRQKGKFGCERYFLLNGYQHEQYNGQTITYIYIGQGGYTLQELFEEYEWQEHYTEDFKPFGEEVEQ